MKTSQIKKFMTLQTKPIKLKFENIKNQEPILKFSTEDIPNINYLYTTIEDTLKNGYTIQQDTLRLMHNVVKRVKKMVDEMDADNNKIRFRVVKSAKKSNNEVTQPKIIQSNCQHNKSTITFPILSLSESRAQSSQLVQNKQNTHYISNNSMSMKENKSSTFSSSYSRQVKLKKFDPKPIQMSEFAQIKVITQQQINLKLRSEARKLLEEVENKKKINGILIDKIKELQEQISLLNKRVQNQELFKIDLKFSLKCIEENELSKQRDKSSPVRLEEKVEQKNEKKERYIEQYLKQLSLMIVSQNKQIETLHKKISEREKELGKKSSRWTSY